MTDPVPTRFANLRDSFVAIRELIIVLAMLSILFAPDRVKSILEEAGIRSLAGVEFDATSLAESEASVEKAHANIAHLRQQLLLAQQELSKVTTAGGTFSDPGLDVISEFLAGAQRSTIETETNLNRSQKKTRDFLHRHGHSHDHSSALNTQSPPTELSRQATVEMIDADERMQR